MIYTEQTGNTAAYSQVNPSETLWDDGGSKWDFNGNAYISNWDQSTQSYNEQSTNTVIWTEK